MLGLLVTVVMIRRRGGWTTALLFYQLAKCKKRIFMGMHVIYADTRAATVRVVHRNAN